MLPLPRLRGCEGGRVVRRKHGQRSVFEVLLPDATQKYGLAEDLAVDREGMVRLPEGPGLGAKIDFELIERKQTAVLA